MSIFKNSKFSKATAYIVSAGTLVPLIYKDCSSLKVFAEGNAQKKLGIFERALRWILSFIYDEENIEKVLVYFGVLAKEQDEKGEKYQKGEDKKEEMESFILYAKEGIDEICDGLADVSTNFFDRLDAKNFNLDPNCLFYGFRDICHVVGNFDRLNSDSCSFETDNQGNLAIRSKWRCSEGETVEKNFHFKVNENGMILVDLHGKVVPFRLVEKENRNFCRNKFTAHIAKGLKACLSYSYIDVDKILRSCLLRSNWETIGVRDNILKLKNIFERKDNNKVFLNKINDAIDIWNLLTPIVSKLNSQFSSNNAFLREQKIVYMHNFLTELFKIIKDKKVKERVRKMLYNAVYRLYSIFQKENGTLPGNKVLTADSYFVNFSQ